MAPLLVEDAAALRAALDARRAQGPVAFVPTMGYLHDGHAALMRAARPHCGTLVVSIFVNPTQFGPSEDLATYPRDLPGDLALCEAEGVDVVFAPTPAVMYPPGSRSIVRVDGVSAPLEGERRPGHFQGVASVVTMLFNLVRPDVAVFGEKDWQQLAVIRQMVRDLHVPVTIVGVPTQREPDGVARSSRNVRLSPEARAAARCVPEAIAAAQALYAGGERGPATLEAAMQARLDAEPMAVVEYAVVADGATLQPVDAVHDGCRLLIAAKVGGVRLIDNAAVTG